MSGSSLDGVDLAYCEFQKNTSWHFSIIKASTYPLRKWKEKLANARNVDQSTLEIYHVEFGKFLGNLCLQFLNDYQLPKPNLIASHGHTVYHFPEKGITCQLGDGKEIASSTKCMAVNELRKADIALGGKGAPIVPIGDLMLFSDYDFCLNLGGIANISYKEKNQIVAYDICVANQILNHYANFEGMEYDKDGLLAKKGEICNDLLSSLSKLDYYEQNFPKALDNGYSNKIIELIDSYKLSTSDSLRTYSEHIAIVLNNELKKLSNNSLSEKKLLITGGGAFNTFLAERISANTTVELVWPEKSIIDFKEALIMAFIGVLKIRNEINCLASVTGAKNDCVLGEIHIPPSIN
jgi:anhydro-N-acetylmuramic acid kinase